MPVSLKESVLAPILGGKRRWSPSWT